MRRTIRLTESELRRMISESVKRALNEEVRTFSSDELQNKWKEEGNSYKHVYPTRNGIDMYTLSNGQDGSQLYFHNKAEAMAWIKEYVTDPKTAMLLKDALSNYSKRSGRIVGLNGAGSAV